MEGKKLYVLTANINSITIKEYEVTFISEDKVRLVPTIDCNSDECYTKENSPGKMNVETYETYSYDPNYHLLSIGNFVKLNRLEFLPNGDIETSKDHTYYATSIKDLDADSKAERINKLFDGNKAIGDVFVKLLDSGDPKASIEYTPDGRIRMVK